MLVEGLENPEVSHDNLGSYADPMSGEGQKCLRRPGYGGHADAGGDRRCFCVSQYEDEPTFFGKTAHRLLENPTYHIVPC